MKPIELENIEKLFWEENSNTYYRTLSSAKNAHRKSYVYRIWKYNNLMKKVVVFSYGESQCSIKRADEIILSEIEKEEQKQQKLF